MTHYNTLNVKLPNLQFIKLKPGIKKWYSSNFSSNLSSDSVGDDGLIFQMNYYSLIHKF